MNRTTISRVRFVMFCLFVWPLMFLGFTLHLISKLIRSLSYLLMQLPKAAKVELNDFLAVNY